MIWVAGGILSQGLGPTRTRHVSSAHVLCTYTGMYAIAYMHIGGQHMPCTYTGMYAIAYMHIGGQHVNVHGMFTCCVRTPACALYAYMHIGEQHSMKHSIFLCLCACFLCRCLIVLRIKLCLSMCAYLHICRDPF